MFGDINLGSIKPEASYNDISDMWSVKKGGKGGEEFREFNFNGFQPLDVQLGKFQRLSRAGVWVKRAQMVEPRRAGKTTFNVIYLLIKAFEKLVTTDFPFLRYGLIYPDLTQAKSVAWDELELRTRQFSANRKIRKNQGHLDLMLRNKRGDICKVMFRLIGLKNYDSKRGGFFDGVIIDEKKDIPQGFKPSINPMIADEQRQPTFLYYSGTPDDSDEFWGEYDDWQKKEREGDLSYMTFWTNYKLLRHLSEDTYKTAIEGFSQAEIDIEFGCKRGVKTGGSYFSDLVLWSEENGRIRDIADNPDISKIVVQDIGSTVKDLYAMWVCQYNALNGSLEVIDYHEIAKATEESVVNYLINDKKYIIKQMVYPWDANVGMTSPLDNFRKLLPEVKHTVLVRGKKQERITCLRRKWRWFHFDFKNTVRGITALRRYSKVWDKTNGVYLMKPKHDDYSHGADAMTYLAQALERNLLDLGYDDKVIERTVDYEPMEEWNRKNKDEIKSIENSNYWLR